MFSHAASASINPYYSPIIPQSKQPPSQAFNWFFSHLTTHTVQHPRMQQSLSYSIKPLIQAATQPANLLQQIFQPLSYPTISTSCKIKSPTSIQFVLQQSTHPLTTPGNHPASPSLSKPGVIPRLKISYVLR